MSKHDSIKKKRRPAADKAVQIDHQLQFTDDQFIWKFSPNQTAPDLLEAIFTGRESLLQNVLEKITESATTGSKHHVLLYGPRGIGKSHFTSLLHHRLANDAKLAKKLRIARLNEDETTTSLVQLLVRIYRSLCSAYPEEYSRDWLDELLNQSPVEITDVLTRRLASRFEHCTLVVLIENLNLLFENLGTRGQKELRTLMQEHPFACLIASSQQLFKAVIDRSQPFFGFFQHIHLKPLSLDDAHQLLLKIARSKGQDDLVAYLNTPDGRGRVRAIHDLAGGNHRVYIVLSGFITRESLDQLVAPFQKMADDLTPYYQERLRWISPQQRQVVELLCRERGTLTPKEIARRLLVSENTIGSQVRKLVEIGYLSATKRGRETFYELSEPLMRLAFEVKEQSLLVMLIDFLRIWYRTEPSQGGDRFGRTEALFGSNRWEEGFSVLELVFKEHDGPWGFLGDVSSMLSLILQNGSSNEKLVSRLNTLFDILLGVVNRHDEKQKLNLLSMLGDGLVKSLEYIDADHFTPQVMESYVAAIEQRVGSIPQLDIPLRLFRYGIRFLISKDPAVFAELIQPERNVLHQVLGLAPSHAGTD